MQARVLARIRRRGRAQVLVVQRRAGRRRRRGDRGSRGLFRERSVLAALGVAPGWAVGQRRLGACHGRFLAFASPHETASAAPESRAPKLKTRRSSVRIVPILDAVFSICDALPASRGTRDSEHRGKPPEGLMMLEGAQVVERVFQAWNASCSRYQRGVPSYASPFAEVLDEPRALTGAGRAPAC